MRFFIAMAALCACLTSFARPASAGLTFDIQLSTDGNNYTDVANPYGSPADPATFAGLTFTNLSLAGTDLPTKGQAFSTTTDLSNGSSTTAETVYMKLTASGYQTPVTPPVIKDVSTISAQFSGATATGADVLTFQSFVDSNSGATLPSDTGGSQNPLANPISNGAYADTNTSYITSLGAPFTITETFKITLGAGEVLQFNASTVLTPLPEPGTMVLWGLGLAGMGIASRRRRKSQAAA